MIKCALWPLILLTHSEPLCHLRKATFVSFFLYTLHPKCPQVLPTVIINTWFQDTSDYVSKPWSGGDAGPAGKLSEGLWRLNTEENGERISRWEQRDDYVPVSWKRTWSLPWKHYWYGDYWPFSLLHIWFLGIKMIKHLSEYKMTIIKVCRVCVGYRVCKEVEVNYT